MLSLALRGFLTGLAGLLPGVCGSTLLVLFGLYRPLTAALAHPVSRFRSGWLPLTPFFLGAGAGALAGVTLLAALFARYEFYAVSLFTGFMLGALPGLFRKARAAGGGRAGVAIGAVLFVALLAFSLVGEGAVPRGARGEIPWGIWVLTGAGIGLGSVLPGASVAFVLIYFGLYQPMLDGLAAWQWSIALPLAAGAGAAVLLFARAADWLFRKAEGLALCGVLGLVLGSIWLVFPGVPESAGEGAIWLLLMVGGAGGSYALERTGTSAPAESAV